MDFICICCDFISEIEKDSICDFTFGVCGRYVCNFIFVSTYVCLWLEFICLWCNLIFEIDMDFICDFFTRNVCGLCLHNYVFLYLLRLGFHLLKITFGAALPSKSIWILCTSAFDLSCMCYYKLRNAIWGLSDLKNIFTILTHNGAVV